MTLELSKNIISGWQLIKPIGIIDSKTVNSLRSYLEENVEGGMPVALDLTDVPFMSSAGLRTLLTLQRQTKSLGVDLALIGLNDVVADTMKVTGFLQYFTTYLSPAELPLQSDDTE